MNISCDIIRDLLPLYVEDLVSEDSRKLVSGHLNHCDACTQALAELKKGTPVPVDASPNSLGKVKRDIRRRRVLSVMAAVLALLTMVSFVITYLFAPFQLTKEQALDEFYIREDGAVVVDYSPYVSGRMMHGVGENWYINQYSNRFDMWKGDHRKSIEDEYGHDRVIVAEDRLRYEGIEIFYGRWETPDGSIKSDSDIPWRDDDRVVEWESEKNWWYADPTGLGNDILLHDAGVEMPAKEDRYHFSPVYPIFYFGGTAIALVMLLVNKKAKTQKGKELASRGMILSGSLAFAVLFTSSGRIFTSHMGIIDQYWGWMIGANTLLLALALLTWRQLFLIRQHDTTL